MKRKTTSRASKTDWKRIDALRDKDILIDRACAARDAQRLRISASPKPLVDTSFAPSIMRAKS